MNQWRREGLYYVVRGNIYWADSRGQPNAGTLAGTFSRRMFFLTYHLIGLIHGKVVLEGMTKDKVL